MGIQTNPAPDDRLVAESTAAPILGLSKFVLRKWRRAGDGPVFYRLGGSIRYRIGDLHDFLNAGRCVPRSATK